MEYCIGKKYRIDENGVRELIKGEVIWCLIGSLRNG